MASKRDLTHCNGPGVSCAEATAPQTDRVSSSDLIHPVEPDVDGLPWSAAGI